MKRPKKTISLLTIMLTIAIAAFSLGAIVRPVSIRAAWIRVTAHDQWTKYNQLGQLLKLGMKPSEVKGIMGPPGKEEQLNTGIRWWYIDKDMCAGMDLILEFIPIGPSLCYVHQDFEARQFLPSHKYYTIGRPSASWSYRNIGKQ